MSRQPRTILVLGGIRSGKSEFAESLVDDAANVRYIGTAIESPADPEWVARLAAHRERRPENWSTEEVGKAPEDLATLIASAGPDDVLLVDDIGGWLSAMLARGTDADDRTPPGITAMDIAAAAEALSAAVAATPARIVLVSPEVGLALVPATPLGRTFTDACGSINRALALVCDGAVLVVAGQPTWLKATAGRMPENVVVAPPARADRVAVPVGDFGLDLPEGESPIRIGMSVPLPDTNASTDAINRAEALPVPGPGLGALTAAIAFVGGAQQTAAPGPFRSVRVIAIHGTYTGALAEGESAETWEAQQAATRNGESPLARLAAEVGASVEILDAGEASPIEDGAAATPEEITHAMWRGYAAAEKAADRGDDLIVLAATGAGVSAAAAALVAALTRAEIPSLLGRVFTPEGTIDDVAWGRRCVAIRDAIRASTATVMDAPSALSAVGGPALAAAAGVVLGAAARRTPLLLDGPVGTAGALTARDYAAQTRLWCLLADLSGDPTTRTAADRLGLEPLVDLGIGLGEGTAALSVLPLIQTALAISSTLGPQV